MACIAALAAAFGLSSRDAEGRVASRNLPRPGGVPDHTTICRAAASLSAAWLDSPLADTGTLCPAAAGSLQGGPAADGSGVKTAGYDTRERPDKKAEKAEAQGRRIYDKFHMAAVLGLQIMLSCRVTGGDAPDTTQLPTLVGLIKKWYGDAFHGLRLGADRGYDSDSDFELPYLAGPPANIRRRTPQPGTNVNRGKPHRGRGAAEFDADAYKRRGPIEGMFGGPESKTAGCTAGTSGRTPGRGGAR